MSSPFAQYVHRLGNASRWVVAQERPDGSYVASLRPEQRQGGLHSYQSRSLLDVAHHTMVYLTRSGALRAARRIYGGES